MVVAIIGHRTLERMCVPEDSRDPEIAEAFEERFITETRVITWR